MKKTCEYPECGCNPIRALKCNGIVHSDIYQLHEHLVKISLEMKKNNPFDEQGRYIHKEFPGQQ